MPPPDEALICGFHIPREGPARAVSAAEIHSALAAEEGVTWLHFRLSDARAERFLLESGLFPSALCSRLKERDSHTSVELLEDGLALQVTDLSFEHADDTGGASTLWGYARRRSFVSARVHALHSVDALRLAVREGLGVSTGTDLVTALFELRNAALRGISTRLADEVNEIEDQILRGDLREQRVRLGRVRRRCAHIRRHHAPDRNALFKLLARQPAWMEPGALERLRSEAEELSHLIDDANELYERAKLLQEELAARLAEKTGDRLYLLSLLSAVFLPMTLVTGVFGMNVEGLPLQGPGGFAFSMLLVLGSGALTLALLRWKRLL